MCIRDRCRTDADCGPSTISGQVVCYTGSDAQGDYYWDWDATETYLSGVTDHHLRDECEWYGYPSPYPYHSPGPYPYHSPYPDYSPYPYPSPSPHHSPGPWDGSMPDNAVLCPGNEPDAYCDCSGDCTGFADSFCACEEAAACCAEHSDFDEDFRGVCAEGVPEMICKGKRCRTDADCGPSTNSGQVVCYCLLYTSPSPRDLSTSRMPSSA